MGKPIKKRKRKTTANDKKRQRVSKGVLVRIPPDPHEKTKDMICGYLEEGMWEKDASRMSGISDDTHRRWKKDDAFYASRVEASILRYKQKLIKVVNLGSIKSPQVGLDILKIRWPKEWNPPAPVKITAPVKIDVDSKQVAKMLQDILSEPEDEPEENKGDTPNS